MKTIATVIATLLATAAFATEPAKTATPTAATAPAKKVEKTVKHKKADHKKAEAMPVKSAAPAAKDTAKTAEPAKK